MTKEERQHHRDQFRKMSGRQKLEHLWMYYKYPFLIGLVLAGILINGIYSKATAKTPALYLGEINTGFETDLERRLCDGYTESRDLAKQEVVLYSGMYLSESPDAQRQETAYVTQMKLLASTNARQLDVVLMDRESYDICSKNGLLLELSTFFPEDDPLRSNLVENDVVSEPDPPEETDETVTQRVVNGLDVSAFPIFQTERRPEKIYLGVITNTARPEACLDYIHYLQSWTPGP